MFEYVCENHINFVYLAVNGESNAMGKTVQMRDSFSVYALKTSSCQRDTLWNMCVHDFYN